MSSLAKRFIFTLTLGCLFFFPALSAAKTPVATTAQLSPMELQRQQYLQECDDKLDDWKQKTGILRRRLKIHKPKTIEYNSLLESVELISTNIKEARMQIRRLRLLHEEYAWKRAHADLESRFRMIDTVYANALAE